MKRKILSLILVFAMTVSLLTVGTGAVEPTYGDTAGHWAESSIERWSGHGIIQGSNGLFDPNGQLTCAQLATILAKLLKLPAAKDAGFTDNTADAWYYDAINRCAAAGILNGNGDGTVTPEAPITRERAMVMLARALGIEPIRKPDLTKYTDAAQVSAYARGYVAALIEAGIVGGVTADELAPQDNINRASTVTILDRAISTYADKAGETVKVDGKGLVLVVAKNVKITGAPEGTKIVVADGATGLTVNGKSVSDDQTYIVPKTEPAKPSGGSSSGGSYTPPHSHSYDTSKWVFDDTTHWYASTCGHNLKIDEAAHTYENDVCTVCGQVKADVAVAKIGNQNYKTLPKAVAAAADGAIITVVKNISLDSCIVISKKVTVDLNGKTVTRDMSNVSEDFTRNEGNLFTIQSAGDLTLKDSTGNGMLTAIAPANNHYSTDTLVLNYGKFTLESGTIKVPEKVYYAVGCYGKDSVTTINGGVIDAQWGGVSDGGIALGSNGSKSDATYGFTLNINGGEIKGGEQTLYLPGAGKTTITGGKLTGSARGIEIRAGELTITGGEISANVARNTNAAANNGASGSYTGALVAVKPASVSASDYVGDIVLNISGGTFTNASGDVLTAVHETATAQDAPAQNVTVSVSDGQFTGAFNVGNTVNTSANDKLSITGGTYSSDPTAYVAEGYIARENNGKYVVSMVGTAENPYTLTEFNALTKLPAGRAKLYVNLGGASLQDGLTIGNDNIADHYYYGEPNSTTAPEGFPHDTGRTDNDNRHIYSTGKSEVNIILTGSVTGATDTGDFNAGGITLKVPDAANVIFDKVIFGKGQMAMSMWTENGVQSMTVPHRLASVTFNGCTFKGNWLQNGAFGADKMTITGCTFEKYENTAAPHSDGFDCKNNSNPIWIQNMGQTNVTIEGCTINAVRPIKLWEGTASGTVTIQKNTFNMEKCSIDNDSTHKNIAIMFCGTTEQVKLGNVEISGNTVTGDATSLICFYNGRNAGENHYPAMNEGATFRLYDNILPEGTALSVIWKSNTEWTPSYVQK